ncbi:MAG: serine/threonine protein kinase, partial [Myxococcales bacterium]|nr:serine/threonine protein kinase [Myxococcales bacterium]
MSRYLLEEKLGQGNVGVVYRAIDQQSGQSIAVKVLNSRFTPKMAETTKAFGDVGRATELGSPHLMPTLGIGEHAERHAFFVEPLLANASLGQRLEGNGPLPPAQAVQVALEVIAGLKALHGASLLHMDLKPANLFLIRDPLGMERAVLGGVGMHHLHRLEAAPTKADGECLARPEYLAPEIASGKPLDAQTDVYLTGVLLYEMLTGRPPFTGGNFKTIARRHALEKPVSPQLVRPEARIGDPLSAVVMRCLEKKPDRRYPTAAELSEALQAVALPDGSRSLKTTTMTPSPAKAVESDEDAAAKKAEEAAAAKKAEEAAAAKKAEEAAAAKKAEEAAAAKRAEEAAAAKKKAD